MIARVGQTSRRASCLVPGSRCRLQATSAFSTTSRASVVPPLLPPQVDRLPPPKAQEYLRSKQLVPGTPEANDLLQNARRRRAGFDEASLEEIAAITQRRAAVSKELTSWNQQAAAIEPSIHKMMAENRKQGRTLTTEEEQELGTMREKARSLRAKVAELTEEHDALSKRKSDLLLSIPNTSDLRTPIGSEEQARVFKVHLGHAITTDKLPQSQWRAIEAASPDHPQSTLSDWNQTVAQSNENQLDANERDHVALANHLHPQPALELAAGRLASGPSFPYLVGSLALLEQALLRHSLSFAVKQGFHLVSPPIMVKTDIAERCGFNPRQGQGGQTYFVSSSSSSASDASGDAQSDMCLVGTAEISLAALVAGRTFSSSNLPLKLMAISPSFRAEAGGRGADTKGLYRLHQFQKAEMFVVTEPDSRWTRIALKQMCRIQEQILISLGITFRVLNMPTEELGASAFKKYDIEAWMPGRGSWGEVSSASNCSDYQASRLHINFTSSSKTKEEGQTKDAQQAKDVKKQKQQSTKAAHTFNATLCAVPRMIITLLEQYGVNEEQGKIRLPLPLKAKWLGDVDQVEWVKVDTRKTRTWPLTKEASSSAVSSDTFSPPSSSSLDTSSSPSAPSPPASSPSFSSSPSSQRSFSTSCRDRAPPTEQERPNPACSTLPYGKNATLLSSFRARLTQLSASTGTDLASLTASFLLLHELTAIIPLVCFFYLFGFLGVGEEICRWLENVSAEEDISDKSVAVVKGPAGTLDWVQHKVAGYFEDGMTRGERYARRKGWWGFEKGSQDEMTTTINDGSDVATSTNEGRNKLAGQFANAVAAYVVTKVSL